jgi:polysaccharide pyruvyl transferase CsaB
MRLPGAPPRNILSHRQILILAGDADGNLGDHAILRAMCHQLRLGDPGLRLVVVSSQPERMARSTGAEVIPKGFGGLFAQLRAARRTDVVLCGGGGLFQDDDSLIKMPYWALRLAVVRLLCPRVIGYSLGVGPLRAGVSRAFTRLAFACMERVTVRDPVAQRTARPLTRKPVDVVPDPALLLDPAPSETAVAWLRDQGVPLDGRPLVGVALRRWFPPRFRVVPNRVSARFRRGRTADDSGSERLTGLVARVLDQVAESHRAHILFLPTYSVAHEGDDRICRKVGEKMSSHAWSLLPIDDPALYKGVTAHLSVLLGGRMHPAILAAAGGTPCVGLGYNSKFNGFFELLGHPEDVLDVASFVREERVSDLVARIGRAMGHRLERDRIDALGDQIRAFNRELLEAMD